MSSFSVYVFVICVLAALILQNGKSNAESCNYATFSVKTIYPSIKIGTFSLSTNRCQSLKATFKNADGFLPFSFNLPFDGSMILKCTEYFDQYYQIEVNLYDDPLCNELMRDEPIFVNMDHNKFTIYKNLQFSLDSLNCNSVFHSETDDNDNNNDESCGISMEIANNCSWSKSQRYLNISVPDNKCISLAPDFKGILSIIPFQILPHEFVDTLQEESIQFSCCSDESLLISNYSDTSCVNAPDWQFRISAIHNGQCFVIGNNEDMVEKDNERETSIHVNVNENSDDTYVYIMRWQCNPNAYYHECDEKGIEIMDATRLPQHCSEQCMQVEEEQQSESSSISSASTRKKRIIAVVGVVVAVVVLFVVVIVGSVFYGRRKALQNQVERNIAGNINVNVAKNEQLVTGDDKYEAFVSEIDQDNTETAD